MPHEAPEPFGPTIEPAIYADPSVQAIPAQAALTPQPDAADRETTVDLIRAVERARKSRVLVYWTSPLAKMADGAMTAVYDQLCAIGDVDRLDLILQTNGGDIEIPWRMRLAHQRVHEALLCDHSSPRGECRHPAFDGCGRDRHDAVRGGGPD